MSDELSAPAMKKRLSDPETTPRPTPARRTSSSKDFDDKDNDPGRRSSLSRSTHGGTNPDTGFPVDSSDVEKADHAQPGVDPQLPTEKATLLTGKKLFLAFVGMLLSIFLIALDQTILSPALPVIASEFNSLDEIGWIASAYFITQTGFLLLYGQLLTCFNRRWVFIVAIAIFELGSLVCALAPTVIALIIARAVAGIGAAGIFVSCLSIIADVTRLEDRPKFLGSFGGVFAASSVIGPLMGGAFTDHLTWRWCFYINPPVGAVTILSILFVIPNVHPPPLLPSLSRLSTQKWTRYTGGRYIPAPGTFLHRLGIFDFIGSALIIGVIVLLVMPLQWGGNQYAWTSPVVIGTLCGFAGLTIIFLLWEWKGAGESTIFPFRLLRSRTQIGACLQAFFMMFCMLVAVYYLPIFYQAAKHASATKSGIDILPLMISLVFAAGGAGFVISATGRYWPFLVIGPIITCIGGGLLYMIDENSTNAANIGFQIVLGVGIGFVLQNVIIAIQANVEEVDIPQATSLVTFAQLVGGVLGIAIAQTVFSNALVKNLKIYAPDAPADLVRFSVEAIYTIDPSLRAGVIHSYTLALKNVFIIGVPAGGLALAAAFLVANKSIKGQSVGAVHAG